MDFTDLQDHCQTTAQAETVSAARSLTVKQLLNENAPSRVSVGGVVIIKKTKNGKN